MFAPPERIEPVAKELLPALAADAPKPEKKKSKGPTKTRGGCTPELVESTLDKADLKRGAAMDYNGAAKWQHDCLSNPDHKKPDGGRFWKGFKLKLHGGEFETGRMMEDVPKFGMGQVQ